MSIDAIIRDADKGNSVHVHGGALEVTLSPSPPVTATIIRPFASFLTNAAGSSGAQAGVAGDEFFIGASADGDRYITRLSFLITGTNAALNDFGASTALSTGCALRWVSDLGDVDIETALKSNFDFVRFCGGNPAIGATTTAFRANNVDGSVEGYIPQLDLHQLSPPWGLKLAKATTQRLSLIVNDTLSGAAAFNIKAYGYDRTSLTSNGDE